MLELFESELPFSIYIKQDITSYATFLVEV